MKQFIKRKLQESFTYDLIETLMGEDYPSSFDMEKFKSLSSFAARIRYCGEHLQRISSGSSRIVYKIDNEKVLKLAWNKKGLAQNEVEIEYGGYYDIEGITARVFDSDPNNLWVEMELARKLSKGDFKRLTGLDWEMYAKAIHNHGIDTGNGRGYKHDLPEEFKEEVWENEFSYAMLDFMGNYGIPAGDLTRRSTYGIVKRDGQDDIVMIDYGLTSDVYDSYYS